MPVRMFWHMCGQVDRVLAQNDLRAVRVAGTTMSEDGGRAVSDMLKQELGRITTAAPVEEQLDRDGLEGLKSMV